MSSTPKVSIIMPTYNRAGYILETVKAVRDQTYPDWELIIIDDGSDDNTEQLIAQIKDERIQFHKAGRVGINGKIKNIGLEKASGELIAFIDSDDLWHATKIEKQVAALAKYPEAGLCLTGGYNFKTPGMPLEFFYKQTRGEKLEQGVIPFFKSEMAGFVQAVMVRKECIRVAGSFIETESFGDIDFILALASRYKMILLYEALLYRRLHETNHSSSNWINAYDQGMNRIKTFEKQRIISPAVAGDALFRLYLNFGEDYLQEGARKKAARIFFKAWRKKPYSATPLKKIVRAILLPLK